MLNKLHPKTWFAPTRVTSGQSAPAPKTRGDAFAQGVEKVSDVVNIGLSTAAGAVGGFSVGAVAAAGVATALGVAGAVVSAPVAAGIVAGGAVVGILGGRLGFKAGKWINRKAGEFGQKLLGKTLGQDKARAAGKGILALAASAPVQLTFAAASGVVGTVSAATFTGGAQALFGLASAADHRDPQPEIRQQPNGTLFQESPTIHRAEVKPYGGGAQVPANQP